MERTLNTLRIKLAASELTDLSEGQNLSQPINHPEMSIMLKNNQLMMENMMLKFEQLKLQINNQTENKSKMCHCYCQGIKETSTQTEDNIDNIDLIPLFIETRTVI